MPTASTGDAAGQETPGAAQSETRLSPTVRYATIVEALLSDPEVAQGLPGKRGFGSGGLTIGGKIFAMLSSRGRFVVKLPRARVEALVASGAGERFDPGHGRLMKEWLSVAPDADVDWLLLAKEALAFVGAQR